MLLFNLIFLTFTNFSHARGGDGTLIGNGGNTVHCKAASDSAFAGFYTLDYLLDYRQSGPYSDLAPIKSWEESRERIAAGLGKLSPVLQRSFREFSDSLMSEKVVHGIQWISWDLTEILINDQEITRRLPPNCYKADGVTPDLHQTVVRSYGKQAVEYRYQNNILKALREQNPLQFSFFIVHEWLWDFTQNVRDLRQLNWILHSLEFNNLPQQQWNQFFIRTQFFNRNLPACHRSEAVKTELEKKTGLSCKDITDEALGKIERLDLASLPVDYVFRAGDFSRLYALKELDLSHNSGILNRLTPFAFNDLLNLETVYANGSGFTKLPEDLLEGSPKVIVKF